MVSSMLQTSEKKKLFQILYSMKKFLFTEIYSFDLIFLYFNCTFLLCSNHCLNFNLVKSGLSQLFFRVCSRKLIIIEKLNNINYKREKKYAVRRRGFECRDAQTVFGFHDICSEYFSHTACHAESLKTTINKSLKKKKYICIHNIYIQKTLPEPKNFL